MAVKRGKESRPKPERELEITLVRSLIGCSPAQREAAKGLGLRKLRGSVVRPDKPEVRGLIRKIPHLIMVEVREKK